jgi:hypothetical protein
MLKTYKLNRNMFFIEQDVKVLFGELAKKTYQLHKNNVKSAYVGPTKQ